MMQTHQQCTLRQGQAQQVAWIESRHARVGLNVKLKEDDSWWKVDEVHPFELASDVVNERSRDYRNHRKATDV